MKIQIFAIAILAALLVLGCTTTPPAPATPMGAQETCGDSKCGALELKSGSCPVDCPMEDQPVPEEFQNAVDCITEGDSVPLIPNPPKCCNGLTLIEPKQSSILGISGICTAKCGNGACDEATESPKNCPADCTEILDAQPECAGVGTSKEGWYQNDKILIYAFCEGCTAYCKDKGGPSEGWYNSCGDKQIKRMCN